MILTILKVIGILLLAVLGLVLLLIVLALVLPVRYRLSCTAEHDKKPEALLKISYFFHILRARAEYTDALYVKVKVLFFTVFQLKIPDKDDEGPDSDAEYDLSELDEALEELDEEKDEQEPYDTDSSDYTDTSEEADESDDEPVEISTETEENESSEDLDKSEASEEQDEPEDKAFDKIKSKIDEICDKIRRVRSEIRYYKNLYNSNAAKNAIYIIKKRLKHILKKVLPRRAHADIVFGFDSPDLTGKVYCIYTIFSNRFDRSSCVIPDFENKTFEGTVFCKGHFNLWCIIWNLLLIVLNKNVRKIYRSYKHHSKRKENEEGACDKAA